MLSKLGKGQGGLAFQPGLYLTGACDLLVDDSVPVGLDEFSIDVQVSSLVAGGDGSFGFDATGKAKEICLAYCGNAWQDALSVSRVQVLLML
jgi:hypothetical protein